MIHIRLKGGLGNQLFQWAMGRAIEARGEQVEYDRSVIDVVRDRRYLLGDFGLELPIAKQHLPTMVNERSMRYQPEFLDMREVTLDGYWQTEKYFLPIADQLRADLFAKMQFCPQTWDMALKIRETPNSCFLHVRRTDNLRSTSTLYHGLTDAVNAQYYVKAVKAVLDCYPDAHFFVFSDDPKWCEANFRNPHCTVVSHNLPSFIEGADHNLTKNTTGREVEDLYLMSLCRHAIIANSTFSLWGAWLNHHEGIADRVVTAPDPWFGQERFMEHEANDLDSTDILPERWLKVTR